MKRTSIGVARSAPTGWTCSRLEHAQQLGLQAQRQVADLVEETGAALRELKPAGLAGDPRR